MYHIANLICIGIGDNYFKVKFDLTIELILVIQGVLQVDIKTGTR